MGAAFAPGEAADLRGAAQLRALAVAGAGGLATLVGLRSALRGPGVRRLELRLARWPAAPRRLPHRADQRHPRGAAPRPALRGGADRPRERARAGSRRGDRRPRRRERRAPPRGGGALRRAARAPRRLLRDREPRLVLGRRRLGGRGPRARLPRAAQRARRDRRRARRLRPRRRRRPPGRLAPRLAERSRARPRGPRPGAAAGAARPRPHDLRRGVADGRRPPALGPHPRRADLAVPLARARRRALGRGAPRAPRRAGST